MMKKDEHSAKNENENDFSDIPDDVDSVFHHSQISYQQQTSKAEEF